jgi:hypothetical protein
MNIVSISVGLWKGLSLTLSIPIGSMMVRLTRRSREGGVMTIAFYCLMAAITLFFYGVATGEIK